MDFSGLTYRDGKKEIEPDQARAHGANHAGYGWSAFPPVHWSDELKAEYMRGYNATQND
jgi:hypothetical protein